MTSVVFDCVEQAIQEIPVPVSVPVSQAQIPPDPDTTALRQKIISLAQSSVGVTLDNLTTPQRLSLVACLLFAAGAVNPQDLTIKPLGQWLRL